MPIAPRYTWGQSKWPVYFWRSVGVVIFALLIQTVNLPFQPLTFTDELSVEVIQQMNAAGETCRDTRDSEESACAVEIWKACHTAKHILDNSKEPSSIGKISAMRYLCDLAVIADAGDLASALVPRYGNTYTRLGKYVNYIVLPRHASFTLFHDLVDIEFRLLSRYNSDDHIWLVLVQNRSRYPDFSDRSGETIMELRELRNAVIYFFKPYRNKDIHSDSYGEIVPTLGYNPWQELSAETFEIPARVKQLCDESREAARESISNYQSKLDRCLQATEICEHASCSLEAGAVEFERMWQQLPEVCASADTLDDISKDDACQEAALVLCDYKLVSPEDEWVEQLISMRDFACAVAGKLPEPQLFCFDNPMSYLCDSDLTDTLEHQKGDSPYLIAFDDSIFTKVGRSTLIDVLDNDIYTDNPFSHPRISLLEFPEMGIAEIAYFGDSYPYIEYTSNTPSRDALSYTICDSFEKCDTAQVKILVTTPPCSITGTQENDVLIGTSRDDVICGLRGDDIIDGRNGNDIIRGGGGDDILRGNLGNDIIYPGPGNNFVVIDETEKDTIIREADDNTVTHIHPDDD